ncbi:MAG: A/G-specific adenine glycosylase [Methylophaga sp.]|nr:MAG: A/G-specific adenine glycosylase [Methylophaga sp.]
MTSSSTFSDRLLIWFDLYGRKDLPWQQNPTPYQVWLSEIMLQQTQVSSVIPYYQRFTNTFPDIKALANASMDDVLALWTGLGYYARARNLHKTARIMIAEHQGDMPLTLEQLLALPGIGRSTAGAIMTLAHHQNFPILDGNVKRVLTRYFAISGWPGNKKIEDQLWLKATQLLPKTRIANYIQAQMDLGATLCTRSKPDCEHCPLNIDCQAWQQGNVTSYPTPKAKKLIPTRQTNWLIAQSIDNKILLQQRPTHGIWGGLWSFPEISNQDNIELCYNQFNIDVTSIINRPVIHHVFTHFKLDIQPHILRCTVTSNKIAENKNLVWYKISDALKLGLPSPVKSFIQTLQ